MLNISYEFQIGTHALKHGYMVIFYFIFHFPIFESVF